MASAQCRWDGSSPWFKARGEYTPGERPLWLQRQHHTASRQHIAQSSFEEPTATGIFASHDLGPAHTRHVFCAEWGICGFVGLGLSYDALVIGSRFSSPHLNRSVALPPDGRAFMLGAEYSRRSHTADSRTGAYLEAGGASLVAPTPVHDPGTPNTIGATERWRSMGKCWGRVHVTVRASIFSPADAEGGPHTHELSGYRATHCFYETGAEHQHRDDCTSPTHTLVEDRRVQVLLQPPVTALVFLVRGPLPHPTAPGTTRRLATRQRLPTPSWTIAPFHGVCRHRISRCLATVR